MVMHISLTPEDPMMDITAPDYPVEVDIRSDGQVLWVNVGGVCRLRICKIAQPIVVVDRRKEIGASP